MGIKVYTVHYRHEDGGSLKALADGAVLVKEGFSWPAFFFGPVWLAWRGLWLALAFYVAASLVLAAIARLVGLPDGAVFLVSAAISLLLGLEGNGLVRWTLERRRLRERAAVTGHTLSEAEERFFAGQSARPRDPVAGPSAP